MLIKEIVDSAGILTKNEKILLALCISTLPAGSKIVELGAACGGSSRMMLTAAAGTKKVYSIDVDKRLPVDLLNHPDFEFFHGTDKAFLEDFEGDADLVFIDGDHSFRGVLDNYKVLKEVVKEKGLFAFHDFGIAHIGVKVLLETLLKNGNLQAPVKSETLLVARRNPGVPMPEPKDYAETILQIAFLYDNPDVVRGCANLQDYLAHNVVPIRKNDKVCFVGRGKCGQLVAKLFGLAKEDLIDSWNAVDQGALYYVCSSTFDKIRLYLVNRKNIAASRIINITPLSLSTYIREDILENNCCRIMRIAESEFEKEILKESFENLSETQVDAMHRSGFLHHFFTAFMYQFPPEV